MTDDPEIGALFQEFATAYGRSRDRLLRMADAMPAMAEYFAACQDSSSQPIADMRLGMSQADLDQVMADYDRSQEGCTEALEAIAADEQEWMRENAQTQLDLSSQIRELTQQVGRAAVAHDRAATQERGEARAARLEELRNAQGELQTTFRERTKEFPDTESSDALLAALQAKAEAA